MMDCGCSKMWFEIIWVPSKVSDFVWKLFGIGHYLVLAQGEKRKKRHEEKNRRV
jgi:hypothetical protein